ncbi:potassium-transporting ATPase subunit KdpA [Candidatus Methylacidiphilum fumarolicum]|uniref:Potassium-transporting ATPase potassium-binding subunit n=2 Tax=Candidatus Methylacidiphilum fumarolicum TaxID=591154 RepID=I0K1F3_METFB|nr:potassium-transporting ATPase subunit KdpA [Candidatus Methylacidiphilum fumarolicum]MBW6414921.1 potassium-transporting ATPase subunit KdpA [Candidatus Methylacidiphilum fumarolicum]TFE70385.1 K+-transporting ATPase subunit A [Candidatus Methylacidiphilum fumarolicum]TFE73934.1 potassium-transporting ATPase subunit KdpA [Candidatus Methylacidiphilum fumarolicum]TFE74441.1 potassium-transporting ATPase subunit KdpA [Candidatus Methylacidiphilum fumarolicum]TFE77898.1 K+-transporting ATPase 
MKTSNWIELGLFISILAVLNKPLGIHIYRVLDREGKTIFDAFLKPLENLTYKICSIDKSKEHNWIEYAVGILLFNFAGMLMTYFVPRMQHFLPLNPEHIGPMAPHIAFNTAISFGTNTNWQSYVPEKEVSYFSQMVGLAFQNFTSAATGIAVAAAFVRGIVRTEAKTVGNCWVDLVRINYYVLLPLSLVGALLLISQGVPQNFHPYLRYLPLDSKAHEEACILPQGPIASQEVIKLLGTNGGGFFNANSAHPYENPTPLSNFMEMLLIFLIPSALTYYFGLSCKKLSHGWSIWITMVLLFLVLSLSCYWLEHAGNPFFKPFGIEQQANMEGKETRFGIFETTLFAAVTTSASCGAVNSMHDSFLPLSGMIPLFNMSLGEIIFGGVGSGLYGMLLFVILSVFLFGLMTGRTPGYLGKRIGAYEIKMAVLALMIQYISILGLSALAIHSSWGLTALGNKGPHGLTETLYAFVSTTENNGSAFGGLSATSVPYAIFLGLAMFFGRYFIIIPVLAVAGSLVCQKRYISQTVFPTSGALFVFILGAAIFLVAALNFFPVFTLGPVLEHLLIGTGKMF